MRGEQGVEGKTGTNGTSVTASQVLFGASSEIRTEDLEFYIDATAGLIYGSQTIVDASGKANHGILSPSGDVGSIWQTGTTPAKFLRFDGTDDVANFGSIINFNATGTGCLKYGSPSRQQTEPLNNSSARKILMGPTHVVGK